MSSFVRSLYPLVVMLILGACSGVTTQSMGSNRDYDFLTIGRDTHVVVRGDPFATGQGRFADRVVAAMQGRDWYGRTRFTTSPGSSSHKYVRVVMLFNGPGQATAFQLCETPERFDSVEPAPGLRVLAAFCVSGHPERVVEASAGGINSTQTPAFAQLIAQTTLELSHSGRRGGNDGDSGNDDN